jgi:hypothetical protein
MAKVEEAQAKVATDQAKELSAQERDVIEARAAAIIKATERLVQQSDYLGKIAGVVEATLPEFIAGNPLGQSIDLFVSLEEQIYEVENKLKLLKRAAEKSRTESFPTRLDAEDCRTTTSKDTGHRMTRTARIFASIVNAKTEAAYQWLKDNNLGSLIKPTVNSSSLSAAAKEAMENGTEFPDDIFSIHIKDAVSITKGRKK